MKKINLFWKTWIITIITIFLSMSIFVGTIYLSSIVFLEQHQKSLLDEETAALKLHIAQYGVDTTYLDTIYQKGMFVSIYDANQNQIYPNNTEIFQIYQTQIISYNSDSTENNDLAITETEPTNGSEEFSFGDTSLIEASIAFDRDPSTYISEFDVNYGAQVYSVILFFPIAADGATFLSGLIGFLPEFVIAAFVVSGIASFLYARYFTRKIKNLNEIINQMSTRELMPIDTYKDGDEIQQLENNLYEMYAKLLDTVKALETEVNYSHRLEKDRSVFMKGATHELKTPIMVMNSMIEGMLENVPGYEDKDKYLLACYEQVQSMKQLVQEILDVTRLEHIKFNGKTNIKTTLEHMLAEYEILFDDKDLNVQIEIIEDTNVEMTEKNAQKILSNLLMNAIKYTPNQKQITFSLFDNTLQIKNDTFDMPINAQDALIAAFVSYQESSFEEDKGHGLGLYVVDYILQQYGFEYKYEYDAKKKNFLFEIYFK